MLPARTRDDNVRAAGTRTQRCFHVPGHSHPVGGGLPHCTPGHHPAGRILAGKTGGLRGLEGLGAGPGESGRQSWERGACHWVTASLRHGGVLKVVRWSGPSDHIGGGGFWGPSCAVAVATSARRNQAKTKQVPLFLCPSAQTKTPSGKG